MRSRIKERVLTTLALVFANASAQAADSHIKIGESGDGATTYWYSMGSTQRSDIIGKAWFQMRFNPPQRLSVGPVEYVAMLQGFKCEEKMHASFAQFFYDAKGKVLASDSSEYPEWSHFPPGTVVEAMYTIACADVGKADEEGLKAAIVAALNDKFETEFNGRGSSKPQDGSASKSPAK